MASVIQLLAITVSLGIFLSLAAAAWWQLSRTLMIATHTIALFGAYTWALTSNWTNAPTFGVVATFLAGALLGILMAGMGKVLTPAEFLLASIALAELGVRVIYQLPEITGGPNGLSFSRVSASLGVVAGVVLLLGVASAVIVSILFNRVPRFLQLRLSAASPPLGVTFGVTRGAQHAAAGLIGGALASVGGALLGAAFGFVHVDDFPLSLGVAALGVALVTRRTLATALLPLALILFGLRAILDPLAPTGSIRGFAALELLVSATVLGAALLARERT